MFPSLPLRIKATFLFPPNSVSVFFFLIQLWWVEKAKILASNMWRTEAWDTIFRITEGLFQRDKKDAWIYRSFWKTKANQVFEHQKITAN